jgi:uncharacterized protein YajQ (UPF0234 family)
MPSFDIVSKVDVQALDNTINIVNKEIANRYDFRDTNTTVVLNKKEMLVTIETMNDMQVAAIEEMLITRGIKQGIDGRSFDFSKKAEQSGKILKKIIKVKSGLEKEDTKKILKEIKESKIKVEAQVMNDIVRVSSKKIDDLQATIAHLRKANLDIPLQFVNMK